IAACHVTAPTWEQTDFSAIVAIYDQLLAREPSPVIALNRAIALCMLEGPERGLAALADLESDLSDYHLFHATRADYQRALALATNDEERRFLRRKIDEDT